MLRLVLVVVTLLAFEACKREPDPVTSEVATPPASPTPPAPASPTPTSIGCPELEAHVERITRDAASDAGIGRSALPESICKELNDADKACLMAADDWDSFGRCMALVADRKSGDRREVVEP